MSDRIGRKATFAIFFTIGGSLYCATPWAAVSGGHAAFTAFFCVILSMYGGGFATIPAYIADIFGTRCVGAIHSRLLAWGTIGILAPMALAALRQARAADGVTGIELYAPTMHIAVFMAVGFVLNLLVKPLGSKRFHDPNDEPEPIAIATVVPARSRSTGPTDLSFGVGAAWTIVALPLIWGVVMTFRKALALFG